MSNIIVVEPERIAKEYNLELAGLQHNVPPEGRYAPYGIAGIVNDAEIVAPECATEEELRDDNNIGTPIFGDAEMDAPATCYESNKVLRVNQLVYESIDPELFEKLKSEGYEPI